jgi:hypothetical protein
MNCNSCHIGTYPTPRFTQTGMLFAARGYTRPYVRERLRAPGQGADDKDDSTPTENPKDEQYGGHYLALNWTDFWSMRFLSQVYTGGEDASGRSLDKRSHATNRLAMFFTGAITDWLGLWMEVGYLGNNSVRRLDPDGNLTTGLNFFAYDEFRLTASWDLDPKGFFGPRSFWGISIGNEHPDVNAQFNFGRGGSVWSTGQGGTGNSSRSQISASTVSSGVGSGHRQRP